MGPSPVNPSSRLTRPSGGVSRRGRPHPHLTSPHIRSERPVRREISATATPPVRDATAILSPNTCTRLDSATMPPDCQKAAARIAREGTPARSLSAGQGPWPSRSTATARTRRGWGPSTTGRGGCPGEVSVDHPREGTLEGVRHGHGPATCTRERVRCRLIFAPRRVSPIGVRVTWFAEASPGSRADSLERR